MTKPDGHLPDGTPVYLKLARGNGKYDLQLEIYRKLCGVPDDEWEEMKKELERGFNDEL